MLPAGDVSGTAELGPELRLSGRSSGIADLALGVVHNLVGSPALAPRDYAAFNPGFSLGVLGKVFVPVGEYSPSKVVNLGANRWSYQPEPVGEVHLRAGRGPNDGGPDGYMTRVIGTWVF